MMSDVRTVYALFEEAGMWQVRESLAPMVRGVCAAMHIPWSESEEEGHYLPSPPPSL